MITYRSALGRGEMRSWIPEPEVTPEAAKTAALDPAERIWTDGTGLRWEVTLEPLRRFRRNSDHPASSEGEYDRLIFKRALYRCSALIPASKRLGELTNGEMLGLFQQADPV